ncbi:hypothetical protein [Mycolicibacterium arenosum]|uniref:Uncharacterized protein n=1 Tax=Mycolicibacterium arenosum TaxID=2952157 RepID=A0ABT1LZX9_9MYCO|nr:hypothetical protein [Mycolicibacterium sp. CAU 1645]MCP9272461.1 hypothetical protein [Mycolicibacterium sp. CAU 1645]
MSDTNTIWIIAAALVALVVVIGLVLIARNKRTQSRRDEAQRLRAELDAESQQVAKRQALAEETDARARAAAAEAEAKAAEARRLSERAASHQETVATHREDLDERRKHIDSLDPDVKRHKRGDDADYDQTPDRHVVDETPRRVENPR